MPNKYSEQQVLDHFLEARKRVTGRSLDYLEESERPDFICVRGNGTRVGVEITEITFGPHESIDEEQALEELHRLIEKKERSRKRPGWTYPERTILVLASRERSIKEMAYLLPKAIRSDLDDHGFREIWLADHTLDDAFGNVELFGLYPWRWWGYHKRPNPYAKPYG